MTTTRKKWKDVKKGDRIVLPVSEVTGRLGKRIFVSIDEHDDWAFLDDAEVEVVEEWIVKSSTGASAQPGDAFHRYEHVPKSVYEVRIGKEYRGIRFVMNAAQFEILKEWWVHDFLPLIKVEGE